MLLGVVARQARSCRGVSCLSIHVCPGHTTQTPTLARSLPVHREQFPPTVLPAARRHTNLTITDCEVMNTWIPDVQPEKPKTVNNALLTMRGSCDYGSGKRHTICVATRVVRLRAFRKRPRPAIEYAATTVTYGSAVDRSRSAETQRHRSFLVRWRRRHAATWHRQRDRRN